MFSDGLLWIPITLAATAAQVVRTAKQHELRNYLSALGAAYVRFLFAWPLAAVLLGANLLIAPQNLGLSARFAIWIFTAALVQIAGTILLLQAFRARDFAIGTVYAKAEVILVATGSAIFLEEPLRPVGWLGAALVAIGVFLLAAKSGVTNTLKNWGEPAAWFGVAAGLFFALSAIAIRGASTSLEFGSTWDRTSVTLFALISTQCLLNGAVLYLNNRHELKEVWTHRRKCFPVGFLSFAGTTGWIAAMTITSATKVRTLGQLEIVAAFFISLFHLKEQRFPRDYLGSALVFVGILLVIALG